MEKRKIRQVQQKRRRVVRLMSAIVVVLICAISTIMPTSAYMFSPIDGPVYAMPLDFVFDVEWKPAGVTLYELSGYLLTPILDQDIESTNAWWGTLETDSGDYYRNWNVRSQSIVGNRLLSIFSFVLDETQLNTYKQQIFTLTADAAVVEMGTEYVSLATYPDSPSYYNAYVEFDYKIAGDTTIYHYEDAVNSTTYVPLVPTGTALGVDNGECIYIYNYYAEIEYYTDTYNVGQIYYPQLDISSITTEQKQSNASLFIAENDRLIAGQGGGQAPSIDNVWLLNSVASFFNFEIFPGFSLGGVMGIVFAITVLIAVLKFVAGG